MWAGIDRVVTDEQFSAMLALFNTGFEVRNTMEWSVWGQRWDPVLFKVYHSIL